MRNRIQEAISEVAMMGFEAGQHAQIVMHTPFYQAQKGEMAPVVAAQNAAERFRLRADAIVSGRDAALAERNAVVQENSILAVKVTGIENGRKNGTAVTQDRGNIWRPKALETLEDVMQKHQPQSLKVAVNFVMDVLEQTGVSRKRGTVENFLRPYFKKPSTHIPQG